MRQITEGETIWPDDVRQWLAMLERMVDGSSNMVVVTDRERRIRWVNATYTRITGWSLPECEGKRPRELLHGPGTDTGALSSLSSRLRQGLSVFDVELLNYKKSGEPYHVSLNIEPIRDRAGDIQAFISIQSDVTQRRELERQTAELGARLQEAERLARLGRIETGHADGRSTWSSEVFRLLGMAPDHESRGLAGLLPFVHADDRHLLEQVLATPPVPGTEIDLEFRIQGVHGGRRWLRCRARPDGQAPTVWSLQDVTIYKTHLEERRLRNEELEHQVLARTRTLEESRRALEEFSYALSHDLRAPLRHVAGFATLLKESLTSGDASGGMAYCERIERAATKMQSLIDGMLSFARAGRGGLHFQAIDLSALVADVVADLHADVDPARVRWRISPGLPWVQGDPVLLREVWVNLLDNALKYSAHRPVSEVEIGCQPVPNGWELFVRDNGAGFQPQHAERLFRMFERLHKDPQFSGEGIGLALVRRILESHGGRIWASSEPDQGATFHVFLPHVPPGPASGDRTPDT